MAYCPADPVGLRALLNAGSTAGAVYDYDDAAVTAGQTYFYWVEDVAVSGAATLHGPLSVDYGAPTAVILGAVSAAPGPASATLPMAAALLALLLPLAGGLVVTRRRKPATTRSQHPREPRIERNARIGNPSVPSHPRFFVLAGVLCVCSVGW